MDKNDKQFQELHEALIALKKEMVSSIHQKLQEYEEPLTETKVLEMLEVSPKTLRKYRNEGLLAYSQIGNKFFYKMTDIQKMLNYGYVKTDNN